jgi:hypothetical protein
MYIPALISLVATCALIGGLLILRFYKRTSLWLEATSSFCVVICVLAFLLEIQPIAAGNNDSGEVFPLVFLPGVWLLAYAILSSRRLQQLRKPEVTPWPQ